jgi:type VI secretion system protein ImpK
VSGQRGDDGRGSRTHRPDEPPPGPGGALETMVLQTGAGRRAPAPRRPARLRRVDLCSDWLCLAAAVRHASEAADPVRLRTRVLELKVTLEQQGKETGFSAADVEAASFALVALLDETVLKTQGAAREAWLLRPLQLELYGQAVAGEEFFDRLERLRRDRQARIEALEVYFACLAFGFGGRYNLAGPEALPALLADLGREITAVRGATPGPLSPHLTSDEEYAVAAAAGVPLWLSGLLFVLAVSLAWLVLKLLAVLGAGRAADFIMALPR